MLNQINKEAYLDEVANKPNTFRGLFIKLLASIEGDYVSYESLKKQEILGDKEREAEEKAAQISLKNLNILAGKNLYQVSEVLRVCAEEMLLSNCSSELKTFFGLNETQELTNQLLPNFISYFIRYKLETALESPDVTELLLSLFQNGDGLELNESTHSLLLEIISRGMPGLEDELQTSYHAEDHKYNDKTNGTVNRQAFTFGASHTDKRSGLNGISPTISPLKSPQKVVPHLSDLYSLSIPLQLTSQPVMDLIKTLVTQAPKEDHNHTLLTAENGTEMLNEKKINNNGLDKHLLKATENKIISCFKASEELRALLLTGLLDYHQFRVNEKKAKKEILRRALESLAEETQAILIKELVQADNSDKLVSLQEPIYNELNKVGMESTEQAEFKRKCVLCDGIDNYLVCGRLIHLKKSEWIHTNCAAWSDGVIESPYGGGLHNVYQVVKKAHTVICPECNKPGGSMLGHSDINKRYHLTCALKNRCVFTYALTDRKINSMDTWVKNSIITCLKHYKHSSLLYCLFCLSMEMITTFHCSKKLYVLKKNVKAGMVTESIKNDAIMDLANSIRETNKKSVDSDSEGKPVPRPLMSRIGNLMLLSLTDMTIHGDIHESLLISTKIKQQYLMGLRKEGLPQAEDYCDNKREMFCLLLKKLVVARMHPILHKNGCDPPGCIFKVYELECNIHKPQIYSIKIKTVDQTSFLAQMNTIYKEKNSEFEIISDSVETVDPANVFSVMFYEMGLCYGEMRAYLFSNLKSCLEKLRQSQQSARTYQHFQHVFYNNISDQQILLDIGDKYSIYDRIKLIWQINGELEGSREFQQDSLAPPRDKHKVGARSRANPKSRSFNNKTNFSMNTSDNCRLSEKLILELCNPSNKKMVEQGLAQTRPSKRKSNPTQKPLEKTQIAIKKGFGSYKTQNIIVAPSNIHKYGNNSL